MWNVNTEDKGKMEIAQVIKETVFKKVDLVGLKTAIFGVGRLYLKV